MNRKTGSKNSPYVKSTLWPVLLLLLALFTVVGVSAQSGVLFTVYDDSVQAVKLVVGPRGPAGVAGANGANGLNGLNGTIGKDGASGANGANGAAGATGAQGVPGSNDCISGICVSRQVNTPGTQETGNINIDGAILADSLNVTTVTATTLAGNGSGLTSLNASALGSGTVSDSRLSANVALLNASNSFSVGQTILSGAAGTTGLIVKGAASQTANLFEIQNSTGSALAYISSSGDIFANRYIYASSQLYTDRLTGYSAPYVTLQNTGGQDTNFILGTSTGTKIGTGTSQKLGFWNATPIVQPIASTSLNALLETTGLRTAAATTDPSIIIKGISSQTGNLMEWQNSAATTKAYIDASGNLGFDANQVRGIYWDGPTFASLMMNGVNGVVVTPYSAGYAGMTIQGRAAQTANLQEWQNSAGSALIAVNSAGRLTWGADGHAQSFFVDSNHRFWFNNDPGYTGMYIQASGVQGQIVGNQGLLFTNQTHAVSVAVMGVLGQTLDLQQWQNSAGTKLASVTSAGRIYAGDSSTTTYSYIAPDGSIGMRSAGNEWAFTYASTGVNLNTAIGASGFMPGGVGTTPGRLDTGGGGLSLSERFQDVYIRNFSPGFTVAQFGTASGSTVAQLLTPVASGKGLVIRANATTPGNLQEWQNSAGTVLSRITAAGDLYTPAGSVIALGSQYLWNSNGIKYNVDAGTAHTFFVGGTEVMRVDSTTNVGIGDDTSPDAKLDVSNTSTAGAVLQLTNSAGTCDHTPTAGAETVSCSSDARLKSNITDAASVLSEINGLKIHDYTVIASGQQTTGLIAQEVINTNPEMVHMGEDGYYKVDSYNSWKILKGIQELSTNADDLQTTFTSALEKANGDISTTNDILSALGLRVDDLSDKLEEFATRLSEHDDRLNAQDTKIQSLEAEIQALKQQFSTGSAPTTSN